MTNCTSGSVSRAGKCFNLVQFELDCDEPELVAGSLQLLQRASGSIVLEGP
jgi:hypothetical protein